MERDQLPVGAVVRDPRVLERPGLGWDLTLQDGTVYVFGTNKPLQAIRDRAGNQVTIRRDSGNKITQVISPNGRWITYSYDSSSRVTSVTDQSGRSYTYNYNPTTSGTIATASTTDNGTTLTTTYTSDSSMSWAGSGAVPVLGFPPFTRRARCG